MARLGKKDIVSIEDLTTVDIERIFELADSFATGLERGETLDRAQGLIMATLFYEPSTRTRLSFESSMHRLGGAGIRSAGMAARHPRRGGGVCDTRQPRGETRRTAAVSIPRRHCAISTSCAKKRAT